MRGRVLQLDVLRALAILMVLGAHMPGAHGSYEKVWMLPHTLGQVWARCGWAGVDLFFVLSGFLISGLLFREHQKYGNVQLTRFLARRGFKIYPAFYCMLLATLIVRGGLALWRGWSMPPTWAFLSESLFIQNYASYVWPPTWSLAVEEHFYLISGIGIYLLTRKRSKSKDPFSVIPLVFAIVMPTLLVVRYISIQAHPHNLFEAGGWRMHGIKTHARFDALLFGVVLSYYMNYHREKTMSLVKRFRPLILGLSCALVSICVFVSPWSGIMYTYGFTCLYLGFGGLLLLSVQQDIKNRRVEKLLSPLALIGYYSYSVYLWHYPVLIWSGYLQGHFFGGRRGPLPPLLDGTLYLICSIAVGVMMAKVVEMPFLRLRDRLLPSRSGRLQTVSGKAA